MLLAASVNVGAAAEERLPLWEATVGVGTLYAPTYRGSRTSRAYALPYPYFRYRGEHFRIDTSGIRRFFFLTERFRLNISIAGGLPAPSKEGSAREGMPELDPTGEIGPVAEYRLWRHQRLAREWWLRFPVRAVVSVNGDGFAHRGWVFAPFVEYVVNDDPIDHWEIKVALGPQFGSGKYHDYYYAVEPEFATAARPAFDASAGYSGSRLTLILYRPFGRFSVGVLARYDNLAGARFGDSPLVQTTNYYIFGVALNWTYAKSKRSVTRTGGFALR